MLTTADNPSNITTAYLENMIVKLNQKTAGATGSNVFTDTDTTPDNGIVLIGTIRAPLGGGAAWGTGATISWF
ncbi:MAG: hypothetical protein WDN27_01255 [Candidatus Saccharibacteria bacterium]